MSGGLERAQRAKRAPNTLLKAVFTIQDPQRLLQELPMQLLLLSGRVSGYKVNET